MLNKKINPNKNRVAAIAALAITGAVAFNMVALQSCKRKQWAADVKTADNRTTNANNQITYTDENGKRRYAAEMPEFDRNIMEYIGKNIVYPEYAKKNKIEGRVMVRVLIDTLGNVLEKEITQSPDASLSQAVMDMLDKMPKWKTNMQNGKPGTEYFLPVLFKLDNKDVKNKTATIADDAKIKKDDKKSVTFTFENTKTDKNSDIADRRAEAEEIHEKVVTIIENGGAITSRDGKVSIEDLDAELERVTKNKK